MSAANFAQDITSRVNHLRVNQLKIACRSLRLPVGGRKADQLDKVTDFILKRWSEVDNTAILAITIIVGWLEMEKDEAPPAYDYIKLKTYLSTESSTTLNQLALLDPKQFSLSDGHSSGQPLITSMTTTGNPSTINHNASWLHNTSVYSRASHQVEELTFSTSCFYKIFKFLESTQSHQIILKPTADNKKASVKVSFGITEKERAEIFSNPKLKLYLLSGTLEKASATASGSPIRFPENFEMYLNTSRLDVGKLQGLKNQIGTAVPADVTSYISSTGQNSFLVNYMSTKVKFLMCFAIVEVTLVGELVQQVMNRPKISTVQTLKELQKEDAPDDIIETSNKVTLNCPLSLGRMHIPAKSVECDHLTCFDLKNFLSYQNSVPSWTCPICSRHIKFEQLAIDEFMQGIIQKTSEDDESVIIDDDGTWRLEQSNDNNSNNKNNNDNHNGNHDYNNNGNNRPPSKAYEQPQEIISISDSEDEPEDEREPEYEPTNELEPESDNQHESERPESDAPLDAESEPDLEPSYDPATDNQMNSDGDEEEEEQEEEEEEVHIPSTMRGHYAASTAHSPAEEMEVDEIPLARRGGRVLPEDDDEEESPTRQSTTVAQSSSDTRSQPNQNEDSSMYDLFHEVHNASRDQANQTGVGGTIESQGDVDVDGNVHMGDAYNNSNQLTSPENSHNDDTTNLEATAEVPHSPNNVLPPPSVPPPVYLLAAASRNEIRTATSFEGRQENDESRAEQGDNEMSVNTGSISPQEAARQLEASIQHPHPVVQQESTIRHETPIDKDLLKSIKIAKRKPSETDIAAELNIDTRRSRVTSLSNEYSAPTENEQNPTNAQVDVDHTAGESSEQTAANGAPSSESLIAEQVGLPPSLDEQQQNTANVLEGDRQIPAAKVTQPPNQEEAVDLAKRASNNILANLTKGVRLPKCYTKFRSIEATYSSEEKLIFDDLKRCRKRYDELAAQVEEHRATQDKYLKIVSDGNGTPDIEKKTKQGLSHMMDSIEASMKIYNAMKMYEYRLQVLNVLNNPEFKKRKPNGETDQVAESNITQDSTADVQNEDTRDSSEASSSSTPNGIQSERQLPNVHPQQGRMREVISEERGGAEKYHNANVDDRRRERNETSVQEPPRESRAYPQAQTSHQRFPEHPEEDNFRNGYPMPKHQVPKYPRPPQRSNAKAYPYPTQQHAPQFSKQYPPQYPRQNKHYQQQDDLLLRQQRFAVDPQQRYTTTPQQRHENVSHLPSRPHLNERQSTIPEVRPSILQAQAAAQAPAQAVAQVPAQAAAQVPAQASIQAPIQAPVEAPVQAPTQAPVQRPAQESAKNYVPAKQPVHESARTVQAPIQQPVGNSIQVTVQSPVQAPAESSFQEPARNSVAVQAPVQQLATQAPVQSPVQAPMPPPVQAPVEPSVHEAVENHVHVEALNQAPVQAPMQPSVQAPFETTVQNVSTNSVEAPAQEFTRYPAQTSVQRPIKEPAQDHTQAPVMTLVQHHVQGSVQPPAEVSTQDVQPRGLSSFQENIPVRSESPVPAPVKAPAEAPLQISKDHPFPGPTEEYESQPTEKSVGQPSPQGTPTCHRQLINPPSLSRSPSETHPSKASTENSKQAEAKRSDAEVISFAGASKRTSESKGSTEGSTPDSNSSPHMTSIPTEPVNFLGSARAKDDGSLPNARSSGDQDISTPSPSYSKTENASNSPPMTYPVRYIKLLQRELDATKVDLSAIESAIRAEQYKQERIRNMSGAWSDADVAELKKSKSLITALSSQRINTVEKLKRLLNKRSDYHLQKSKEQVEKRLNSDHLKRRASEIEYDWSDDAVSNGPSVGGNSRDFHNRASSDANSSIQQNSTSLSAQQHSSINENNRHIPVEPSRKRVDSGRRRSSDYEGAVSEKSRNPDIIRIRTPPAADVRIPNIQESGTSENQSQQQRGHPLPIPVQINKSLSSATKVPQISEPQRLQKEPIRIENTNRLGRGDETNQNMANAIAKDARNSRSIPIQNVVFHDENVAIIPGRFPAQPSSQRFEPQRQQQHLTQESLQRDAFSASQDQHRQPSQNNHPPSLFGPRIAPPNGNVEEAAANKMPPVAGLYGDKNIPNSSQNSRIELLNLPSWRASSLLNPFANKK